MTDPNTPDQHDAPAPEAEPRTSGRSRADKADKAPAAKVKRPDPMDLGVELRKHLRKVPAGQREAFARMLRPVLDDTDAVTAVAEVAKLGVPTNESWDAALTIVWASIGR